MAQAGQTSFHPPTSLNREESSSAASSSSSSSSSLLVREEEENNEGNQHRFGDEDEVDHRYGFFRGIFFGYEDISAVRSDTWSCAVVVLTFWFFVSMTLILGVYGPVSIMIGPNSSVLIQPSSLFLQSIEVQELDSNHPGLVLYGFHKTPPLNVVKSWFSSYNTTVPVDSHKEWLYYLNEGSQINISYRVNSPSSSLILVISQGNGGLAEWLEDPTYPNSTLSWNFIDGSGTIQQHIQKSSTYYVAAGNLNSEDIEVQLNLSIRALLYNTTEAYYTCAFTNAVCKLDVSFPSGNAALLTSHGPEEESPNGEWYVKLSYGPRWATYVVGIAAVTLLMLLTFNIMYNLRCIGEEVTGAPVGEISSERAPLLLQKDDDLSSWGSYDSLSNDEDDLERLLASGSLEGKPLGDGENGNNTLRLCAICFDAPRDCFFLPCGHCVTCFECGTRLVEAAGTCPVCRRNMKKVRKIFTV